MRDYFGGTRSRLPTHAASAKDTSVTAHCHAATALLTREYQGDHRRSILTPASTCTGLPQHPLTTLFHIGSSAKRYRPTSRPSVWAVVCYKFLTAGAVPSV
jgi:hypothetical protein